MPISKLVLQNYRSFRDRQEIELAPVTVVLGKNNSGKSALTRLPLLLASGFGTRSTAPLDLGRLEFDAVDDFRDLFFEQKTIRPLMLGLDVDGPEPFSLRAGLEYVDGLRTTFVADLTIHVAGVSAEYGSRGALFDDPGTPDPDGIARSAEPAAGSDRPTAYEVRLDGRLVEVRHLAFCGLLPDPRSLDADSWRPPALSPGAVRYLGPYRDPVVRHHRLPIGTPPAIGPRGEGLPGLLARDRQRDDREMLRLINSYLAQIIPDWEIDEVPAGPLWSTVLVRKGSRAMISLADAGSGLAQILPILAQCAHDQIHGQGGAGALQIIEEPEMHLHPAAHAELADLYLAVAKATGTRFLIETHSETLLLRLRRRIAELDNAYGPEHVAIYVVEQHKGESNVRRVNVDSLGNLEDNRPEGYFSQDYHEVRALAAAQLDRSGRAS